MIEKLLFVKESNGTSSKTEQELITQYSVQEDIKQSISILVAEDNPVNLKLVEAMLTKGGYSVTIAVNGTEVVKKYTTAPQDYNLILMDIQLPELSGYEATKQIRQWEKQQHQSIGKTEVPIIAMTAYALKGDREKCLSVGMTDYISKPISRQAVYGILKEWVINRSRHN